MSDNDNVYDLFGDADENEGDENEGREIDPAVVAFMDQQSAEYNAMQSDFEEHYGFRHDCKCDQDYSKGNLVEVTECYANMAVDALEACARMNSELAMLRGMISQAMGLAISSTLEGLNEGLDGSVHTNGAVESRGESTDPESGSDNDDLGLLV